MYDVIIVGGGPAGLSAALILGRSLRKVLVIDNRHSRNLPSRELHGYLGMQKISPAEFIEKALLQLRELDTIEFVQDEAVRVQKNQKKFRIETKMGQIFASRKLLLATGVVDELPAIAGLRPLFGKSVFHCAYCDGWEMRGRPIAVLGEGPRGYHTARFLKTWTSDIVLCTNGKELLTSKQMDNLKFHQIRIRHEKISHLEAEGDQLRFIHFENGNKLARDGIFINTPTFIRSHLLDQLGCPYTEKEGVETGKYETTKIPGLFAAGNILRDVQMVIVAAAEGAQAAFGINAELSHEDLEAAENKGSTLKDIAP